MVKTVVGADITMKVLVVSEAMVEVIMGTDATVKAVLTSETVVMIVSVSDPMEALESVVETW